MSQAKKIFTLDCPTTALMLTLSLFVLWGMGQYYYYTMMPQVSAKLHLHGLTGALADNLASIAYFVCALPAAIYARRLGYKAALLLGLGSIGIGCFTLYPAVALGAHGYYFIATASLSAGWVVLEVAANPMVANFGPDESFVWRLSLAQALYPIGSILAVFVSYWLLGTYLVEVGAKFVFSFLNPFILLGAAVLLIAYWIEETPFPPAATARKHGGEYAVLRQLLTERTILAAMAAQGLGIVILATNGVMGARYLMPAFHLALPGPLGDVYFWSTVAFAAGRWCGWALMRYFPPERLLAVFSIGGCASALLALIGLPMVSAFAVYAIQLFAAILWPTILGLAIRGKGSAMQVATALICMGSALGGTFAQQLFAYVPDFATRAGMWIPALCFLGILGFTRLIAASREAQTA
jgi:FHS family L-fucose permease-like MFS transporter